MSNHWRLCVGVVADASARRLDKDRGKEKRRESRPLGGAARAFARATPFVGERRSHVRATREAFRGHPDESLDLRKRRYRWASIPPHIRRESGCPRYLRCVMCSKSTRIAQSRKFARSHRGRQQAPACPPCSRQPHCLPQCPLPSTTCGIRNSGACRPAPVPRPGPCIRINVEIVSKQCRNIAEIASK